MHVKGIGDSLVWFLGLMELEGSFCFYSDFACMEFIGKGFNLVGRNFGYGFHGAVFDRISCWFLFCKCIWITGLCFAPVSQVFRSQDIQ